VLRPGAYKGGGAIFGGKPGKRKKRPVAEKEATPYSWKKNLYNLLRNQYTLLP